MRCLVTGASGHVGSYVAKELIRCGHEVIALVRESSNLSRLADVINHITIVKGDITTLQDAEQAIVKLQPDVIIHAAWSGVTADTRNDPTQIIRNVCGTLELFRICQTAGCKTWIGVGSQAEYGHCDTRLHENLPAKPTSVYGISKYCTSMLVQKMCELADIRFVWVRLLAAYGPEDDPKHLVPSVISTLLQKKKPSLTPGEQKWDYLYITDVAEAIAGLVETQTAMGYFNLGSGRAVPVRSIVEKIRDLIDPSLPLGFGERSYGADQPMLLEGDITRLTQATGWTPKVTLEMGLKNTVDWHRRK